MKVVWIIFGLVLGLLLLFGIWRDKTFVNENIASDVPQTYSKSTLNESLLVNNIGLIKRIKKALPYKKLSKIPAVLLPDSIVAFGLSHVGDPYLPAGVTCEGFDCSGFIYYIFKNYGVELPHSSALLLKEGEGITLNQVRKGDLLIFTGTNEADRSPGHAGVVITNPGEPIKFVHSSSAQKENGVKVSQFAGTGYEQRFLEARRVL